MSITLLNEGWIPQEGNINEPCRHILKTPRNTWGKGTLNTGGQARPRSSKILVAEGKLRVCPPRTYDLLGKARLSLLKNEAMIRIRSDESK